MRKNIRPSRRGAAAVLAMLYLSLLSTLTVAMYAMANMNVQTSVNHRDVERARAVAESGLRWMEYRFLKMNRTKTTIGNITGAVADALWPDIKDDVEEDLLGMTLAEQPITPETDGSITTSPIRIDDDGSFFVINISQNPLDHTQLVVKSTGYHRNVVINQATGTITANAVRSCSMNFQIEKKVKYAVVGKVPIQIGRNVIVEGPMAMLTPGKYPPFFMLSDFRHLTPGMQTKIDAFQNFCELWHKGWDNRIDVKNTQEYDLAIANGYNDHSGDGFIDEYDIFLNEFDNNNDKRVSTAEFTNPSTGKLYDPDFFSAIDSLNSPMQAGEIARFGYQDGYIDENDGYAKVRGQIAVATSATSWSNNLSPSGQRIQDMIMGPIIGDEATAPVKFGVTAADVFDLSPSNFDTTSFKDKTGSAAGAPINTATVKQNLTLTAAMANGGTADERTPYGSTAYQATYRRPVFQNMTFRNVRIPRGLNARFDNCTFEGVTFVELEPNITTSSGATTTSSSQGMTWAQRMKSGYTFNKSTALTTTNSQGFDKGNNLRFNDCTIKGPLASDVPTAYTHFGNSWEFTGATLFDNQFDETATIIAPQANIEMGSFTDPSGAPSTLKGVVVAGNLDIRGTSYVDGSIIITGDGAGNTTMGWFGASDASTETTSPMPEGGWGKINIRYNPNRALPDGINIAIDITARADTYTEGQ